MINTTIGKYTLTRLIGEGGMASVYEAEHEMLGTKVAIKVLNPILSANAQIRERFKNEAKMMASFNHPNITKIIDFDDQPHQLSIVMEFLEGEDLNEKIKRSGPLSQEAIKDIFVQTLSAFQYAHEKGVVHRDIKPSNIYVLPDGHVKILDFGIAKLFGQGMEMTQTGTQIGTPSYMSPEQVKAEKYIDHRSDIYALGVTLFCAASGTPPYDSSINSHYSILNKIVIEPLPALATNVAFQPIISKACQKNRELRYQSCNEFVTFLSRVRFEQTEETVNNPHHSHNQQRVKTETSLNPMEPVRKKQPLTLMIGAAAAVILIAIGIIFLTNASDESTNVSLTEDPSGKDKKHTHSPEKVQEFYQTTKFNTDDHLDPTGKPTRKQNNSTGYEKEIVYLERVIYKLNDDLDRTDKMIQDLKHQQKNLVSKKLKSKVEEFQIKIDALNNRETQILYEIQQNERKLKALKVRQLQDDKKP